MAEITTDQVWEEVEQQIFAVLGMVSARNEARTVGIVYIVHDRKLYIATGEQAWKVRHVRQNPNVSLTVTIPKRIAVMPWIKIPAATITFCGTAQVLMPDALPADVLQPLFRGLENVSEDTVIIEVTPTGNFLTYGVGVSLREMRDTVKARGRVGV